MPRRAAKAAAGLAVLASVLAAVLLGLRGQRATQEPNRHCRRYASAQSPQETAHDP
jgi:hypothetical protein